MGEKWEQLQNDPIVRDLKSVLGTGVYEIEVDGLNCLPELLGEGKDAPAGREEIRKALLAHLKADDPGEDADDPDLAESTKFNLRLFRATTVTKGLKLGGARHEAGKIRGVRVDAVRKPPSHRQPRGGHEWRLILALRERIIRTAVEAGRELPDGLVHTDDVRTYKLPKKLSGGQPPATDHAETRIAERQKYAKDLDEAWTVLDACRSKATDRDQRLHRLKTLADTLANDTELDEAAALVEFAAYESDRGLEKYRLEQGVRLLEAALSIHDREERGHKLRLLLMNELAHLAIYGGLVPGDRRETLRRIIDLGDSSLADPHIDSLTLQQIRVAVAEALKELCFVTHDAVQQKELYHRARAECELVETELAQDKREAAVRIVAHAKRHAAITYELEEDKERNDKARERCIGTWSRLCREAAKLAGQVGDDYIRGYCLLNLGSAQSRLTYFHGTEQSKAEALAGGKKYLGEALSLVDTLNDDRGRAWVYLHLCENTGLRANLEPAGSTQRMGLLRELEFNAIHAFSHFKHLDDPLGLTLAHLHLGKALCLMHEERDSDAATFIRLERATDLLSRAVNMAQEIAYYQEYPAAARWLARCIEHSWPPDASPSSESLIKGINALITGLCEHYAGQGAVTELESLFQELASRLDEELRKHR